MFHDFPWTDMHELNLDWFLAKFKELVEEWNQVQGEWTSLHDYVQNYFDNLNVQTEIDNKINDMILDGTFADIVSPFVTAALPSLVAGQLPDVVAAQISAVVAAQLPAVAASAAAAEVGYWLTAHIDPDTGYVIDKSLTVSDAAADAKVVGDLIRDISEPTSNRYNPDAITDDKYIVANGTEYSDNTFFVTDYIPVTPGENLYFWGKDTNDVYASFIKRFLCAYDSSKNVVEAAGKNSEFSGNPLVIPAGIAYVRFSIVKSRVLGWSDLYCGSHSVGVDYEKYGIKIEEKTDSYVVHNGESILDAVKYCYANNLKNINVEAGTYDIISEYQSTYGATYFDDYINYAQGDIFDAGIWLENINIKFEVGAKVECKYAGNNQNVIDYFSAFATGNNVLIDGLVLDSENLRYGIHADFNSGDSESFFIMKNCDIKNVRTDGNKDVGAGLGKHVFWIFENCIFRTTGNYYAMRIHNSVSSEAESKIIVKDCYIDGDGYFVFNAYSNSTKQTIIQICGNSYKNPPVVGRETPSSNDNFTMIAWNNELR